MYTLYAKHEHCAGIDVTLEFQSNNDYYTTLYELDDVGNLTAESARDAIAFTMTSSALHSHRRRVAKFVLDAYGADRYPLSVIVSAKQMAARLS